VIIRPGQAEDADRCAQIGCNRSPDELKELLKQPDVRWIIVVGDSGEVVGTGIINLWRWNGVAWVWDLRVDGNERGKGYGTALLKGMIETARDMGAKVLMDFDVAHQGSLSKLYLNNDFRICGTNDRMFPLNKDSSGVYYGYDL
jgi:GNAT superfamily N-acetyltransferase